MMTSYDNVKQRNRLNVSISVVITDQMLKDLERAEKISGKTRSMLMRQALKIVIKHYTNTKGNNTKKE